MQETFEISIRNRRPENDWRLGIATLPWGQVAGLSSERLKHIVAVVTHPQEEAVGQLQWQLDRVDPENPDLDVLSIYASFMRAGGPDGKEAFRVLVTVDDGSGSGANADTERRLKVETTKDWFLHGSVLKAFVQLTPGPFGWQAGAITSVRLGGIEVLDAFRGMLGEHGHDEEKRLQLDRVSIAAPPWSSDPETHHYLHQQPWTYVESGSGDVRMFLHIRSPRFMVAYGKATYRCSLHRVISVYRHSDSIVEELFLEGSSSPDEKPVRFSFSPGYFLKMHFADAGGNEPVLQQVPRIQSWFALSGTEHPKPGFGFAANEAVRQVLNPTHDYPRKEHYRAVFAWDLAYARKFLCVHTFTLLTDPSTVADEIGRRWYDFVYMPPYAITTRRVSP
ncbi:MAG: hypothetical protein ABI779_17380 [Acidobacteriota bacterium]